MTPISSRYSLALASSQPTAAAAAALASRQPQQMLVGCYVVVGASKPTGRTLTVSTCRSHVTYRSSAVAALLFEDATGAVRPAIVIAFTARRTCSALYAVATHLRRNGVDRTDI